MKCVGDDKQKCVYSLSIEKILFLRPNSLSCRKRVRVSCFSVFDMQSLLSSMAVDLSVEWKFWQILRGFRFWEAFVKSLGGRANQRNGDHQKLDWTLIVRPFAFEELRLWFIHRPQIPFLHPSKIMGWSCQRVGWEYLSAIIRGGAHFCLRWMKNECRSMCRGGAKASFFRCRQSPSDVSAEV